MEIRVDASLTDDGHLDVDLPPGETIAALLLGLEGRRRHPAPPVWCGGVRVSLDHRVGVWPLVAGAIITAGPAPWPVVPRGPHLAVVGGPDAGWLLPLVPAVTIGAAPKTARDVAETDAAGLRLALADPTLDADHAHVELTSAGASWRDLASTNGTGIVRGDDGARVGGVERRPRGRLADGELLALGRSVVAFRSGDGTRTPSALPDPTSLGGCPPLWRGDVRLSGPLALATARAVLVARGALPRSVTGPLATRLLAEPWLPWLPPAPASDGALSIGDDAAPDDSGALCAASHGDALVVGQTRYRPLGVSSAAAELTTRALASRGEPGVGRALALRDLAPASPDLIVWGSALGGGPVTWAPWAPPSAALVIGAQGTGRTTTLRTAALALARTDRPGDLELVVIAPGGESAWRVDALPAGAVTVIGSGDESAALDALQRPRTASRRLVIVDGADLFASGSVAALAARLPGERGDAVVMSSTRVTGVVTPALLASATIVVGLRATDAAASADAVGIADAAGLPPNRPGLAYVRAGGRVVLARIAIAEP